MGKYYLSMLALLLTVSLSISGQTKKASPALTKENANKIIGMTNSVVDIYNNHLPVIKNVRECLERFDNSISNIAENPNTTVYGASCTNIGSLRSDLTSKLEQKSALAPSFPEKQAILDGVNQLGKEFEIAKERCQIIQDYLKSKKYKEDDKDFSNYVALRDTFMVSYKNINNLFDQIINLSSVAGDRAELVILKSHPLAPVIIPMKTNLSAVSQILSKCRADEPNAEEIKAEIVAIRKSLEKDKVMTPAKKTALAKANNGEAVFERFYEYTEGALDKTEIFIEYLDPNKQVTVDHVLKETEEAARNRHLKAKYDEVQKYYGYMVDAYNTL